MNGSEQPVAPWRQESTYGSADVHRWKDLDEFHAASAHADGFHVIEQAHGAPLELLTIGEPFEQESGPTMVVFSGAVGKRRERTPPFVSGRGLGPKLGVPLIALSDPSLAMKRDLNIAWYAGSIYHDVQTAVHELLRPLAVRLDGDLWLVGGSAGGFAALEAAHRLGRHCSAFVWNPQTDVASYSALYARRYAEIAFPQLEGRLQRKSWKSLFRKEARSHHRRVDLVREVIPAQSPRRLLYLQGVNDWHMRAHCAPYLRAHLYQRNAPGIWTRSENQVVWLAEAGTGHAPPRPDAIQKILTRLMADDDSTVLERVSQLDEQRTFAGRALSKRPERLERHKAKLSRLIDWRVSGQSIVAEAPRLPKGFGRMRWSVVVLDAKDDELSQSAGNTVPGEWEIPSLDGAHHARITLTDGFGAELIRKKLPLAR